MSDLKRSCPACEAWTSSVGAAFRDGESCPYCGLPAEAAFQFDRAVARGADEQLAERFAKAEGRAAKAEAEVARLRALLREVGRTAARVETEAAAI